MFYLFIYIQVQGVCDHVRNIIWYSGPHIGTTHDLRIWAENTPPLLARERYLGDKAYIGQDYEHQLIVPFKEQEGEELPNDRKCFNLIHRWYRATIEHTFSYVKRFRILNSVYRGRITSNCKELEDVLSIIINSNYLHTKNHPRRNHEADDMDINEVNAALQSRIDWIDPVYGTGMTYDDFIMGELVTAWYTSLVVWENCL